MRLMIKYTILTAIALISSAILLVLIVFFGIGAEFAAIDEFLNCYCLFLMSNDYRRQYRFFCGACQKCLVAKFYESEKDEDASTKSKDSTVHDVDKYSTSRKSDEE